MLTFNFQFFCTVISAFHLLQIESSCLTGDFKGLMGLVSHLKNHINSLCLEVFFFYINRFSSNLFHFAALSNESAAALEIGSSHHCMSKLHWFNVSSFISDRLIVQSFNGWKNGWSFFRVPSILARSCPSHIYSCYIMFLFRLVCSRYESFIHILNISSQALSEWGISMFPGCLLSVRPSPVNLFSCTAALEEFCLSQLM